jgi:excinuclease UvrABC nuclease subunit
MSNFDQSVRQEAERILQSLNVDFSECSELLKDFRNLPNRPGIYAVRYETEILYIGRSNNIRTRFQSGHKALGWALMDGLQAQQIRIAAVTVELPWFRSLKLIEEEILRLTKPSYNVQYPLP